LEILYYNEVDSTQLEAKRLVAKGKAAPFCIVAEIQSAGMGSRENRWDSREGNLFFSFVHKKDQFPEDIPLSSLSIYFGYILKLTLQQHGSTAWLKWPNDIYIGEKKIGGLITHLSKNRIVCGIGLNLVRGKKYDGLDIEFDKKNLIKAYFSELEKFPTWKKIFRKFRVEFDKSKGLKSHADGQRISLQNASLQHDGSLLIDGKRVYSLR
jgi:BirA family biotin operon repressor/biotin-[acetyl-CoA-carboxylase] ligase